MDKAIESLFLNVPAAGACVFMAWMFLRSGRILSDNAHEQARALWREAAEQRRLTREVIERNTQALTTNTEVSREETEAIRRLMSELGKRTDTYRPD